MIKPATQTADQPALFPIEGNTANRNLVRELSKNTDWLRKIDIGIIEILPNFNARIKPEGMSEEAWEQSLMIADLADGIYASNGPADPITGDFHSNGKFYINEGERRTRALRHLIRAGREFYPDESPVAEVLVLMNPPGTTDLDRKKKVIDANNKLPFLPMQKAHYYLSMTKEPYNLTHDEIAALWSPQISRQTVDNYILATELPQHVQDAIDSGETKMTNALAEIRKARAEKKKATTKNANPDDEEPIITGKLADDLEKKEKEKEKLRGDEEDFEQQDNSVNFGGSKLSEDKSSGAHVVGKDSIYMQQQRFAAFKRMLNRYDVLFESATKLILPEKPGDEEDEERAVILFEKREKHVIEKLMEEYDITVK